VMTRRSGNAGQPDQPGITEGRMGTRGSNYGLRRRAQRGWKSMARSRSGARGERKKALWLTFTHVGTSTFTSGVDGESLGGVNLPQEGTVVRTTGSFGVLNNTLVNVAGLLLGNISHRERPTTSSDYEAGLVNPTTIMSQADDDWMLAQPFSIPAKQDNAPYFTWNFDQRAKRKYEMGDAMYFGLAQNSSATIGANAYRTNLVVRLLILY